MITFFNIKKFASMNIFTFKLLIIFFLYNLSESLNVIKKYIFNIKDENDIFVEIINL